MSWPQSERAVELSSNKILQFLTGGAS